MKRREPLAVDAVVLLEPAEVEPVAAELGGQAADAVVAQHPPGLGDEHLGAVQVAGGGPGEQLVVGHARPEEVAQAAGQGVVRQRLDAGLPPRQVDAVAEVGRHQHADDRVADGVLVAQPVLLAQRRDRRRRRRRAPPVDERPAVGPLGERLEGLDVARLGRQPRLLDPADARGDDPEMVLDRLERRRRSRRCVRAFAR